MIYLNSSEKMVKEAQSTRITKAKAIRYKCLDCCGFQANEVRECTSFTCPLYRYRMGHEEKDKLYKQNLKNQERKGVDEK